MSPRPQREKGSARTCLGLEAWPARDRQVWDFPLMNVASAMVVNGGNIEKIRIVVNAAAANPLHYAPDIVRDPMLRQADRFYLAWIALGMAVPFGFGWIFDGSSPE